jgi:tRNA(Ile2) C34 agmatinyltransferase TiaS
LLLPVNFNLCFVTPKGAQEMTCTVDEESGDFILSFESCQITESSHFVWKKFYKEITDFSKEIVIKTEGST